MKDYNLYAFADETGSAIDHQIAAMKRNHLDGLEIRNVDGQNVSEISCEKAKEVRKKMDDAGLLVWSVGSPIGKIKLKTDDFSAHCDTFAHTLEVADILGAKNIRLFSFYVDSTEADAAADEVIDRMGKFLSMAKGSGVSLCHENEKGIFGDTAVRCKMLLDALPELCGIFDPANFIQCGESVPTAWQLLYRRIHYMHVKDCLKDGPVVPSGKGDGCIAQLKADFLAHGGRDFTIEPHLTVFDGLAALEEDGKTSVIGENRFHTADEAFDTACEAFRNL